MADDAGGASANPPDWPLAAVTAGTAAGWKGSAAAAWGAVPPSSGR